MTNQIKSNQIRLAEAELQPRLPKAKHRFIDAFLNSCTLCCTQHKSFLYLLLRVLHISGRPFAESPPLIILELLHHFLDHSVIHFRAKLNFAHWSRTYCSCVRRGIVCFLNPACACDICRIVIRTARDHSKLLNIYIVLKDICLCWSDSNSESRNARPW